MNVLRCFLYGLFALYATVASASAASEKNAFEGRWRLDTARSTPLDGWHAWDLVVRVDGSQIHLQHDMRWIKTQISATNTVDVATPVVIEKYFRVEQRHAALYPAKGGKTSARAAWLDNNRTLRVEADTPIETSQGDTRMRIYSEYRLLEGDGALLLVELHNTRPRPLVYRFNRVSETK